jgi:hypothetical protein
MTPHIPEEFSTRLIDWSPFVIMGNTMPPRDPDEDEGRRTKRKRTAPTNRRSCSSRKALESDGVGGASRPRACFGDSAALRRRKRGPLRFLNSAGPRLRVPLAYHGWPSEIRFRG